MKTPLDPVRLSSIPPSRAISLQSTSYPPTSRSASPTTSASSGIKFVGQKGLSAFEHAIVSLLDINIAYTRAQSGHGLDLKDQYKRYCALNLALDKFRGVNWREVIWKYQKATNKDVIEIFIGKSQYYSTWRALFGKVVTEFDDMKRWLENDETVTTKEVWRVVKPKYDFSDLEEWIKTELEAGGKKKKQVQEEGTKSGDKKKKKKKKSESSSPSKR